MKHFIPFILTAVLFTGCTGKSISTVTIWTDIPEIAVYTEYYNSLEGTDRCIVVFKQNPAYALTEEEIHPDVVIGRYLNNSESKSLFYPIDSLAKKTEIPLDSIYPGLLNRTKIDGTSYTVPLSFNLPGIIFPRNDFPDTKKFFYLSPEDIQTIADRFNSKSGEHYIKMGFNPLWEPELMLTTVSGFGTRFRTGEPYLIWEESALKKTVSFLRKWITESGETPSRVQHFAKKYLYEPEYKLIKDNRIFCAHMTSSEFLELPAERRDHLDIRWFEIDGKVPVLQDIVYAAVPEAAEHKKAGGAYIKWLLDPEIQEMLITGIEQSDNVSFGFAQGFSSVEKVSARFFPEAFPFLLGKIPSDMDLLYPEPLPKSWPRFEKEVLLPWIEEAVSSDEGTSVDLGKKIETWLLQGGAY
ncbi:MAG: hypothetical protein ACLFSE_06970 [Spirochaetia bacterium]